MNYTADQAKAHAREAVEGARDQSILDIKAVIVLENEAFTSGPVALTYSDLAIARECAAEHTANPLMAVWFFTIEEMRG